MMHNRNDERGKIHNDNWCHKIRQNNVRSSVVRYAVAILPSISPSHEGLVRLFQTEFQSYILGLIMFNYMSLMEGNVDNLKDHNGAKLTS